jgi:hypothetical protein
MTYDISIEDLKRYRKLSAREVLRWLTQVNELHWKLKGKAGKAKKHNKR